MVKGLDEAWAKVDPSQAYAQGYRFIMGYVSEDTTGKNLTPDDVARIHAAGMAVAFFYEYNPSAALGGYASGVTNAKVAIDHFKTLGVPTGVACYNSSTDFDVQPGQMSTCLAHETGFGDTMRAAGYRYGAYTGYPFGLYLTQHNYGGFICQTYAWSSGAWLAAAAIRQTQNGIVVAGMNVDLDMSEVDDFGQWQPIQQTLGQDTAMFLAIDSASNYYLCDGMVSRPVSAADASTIAYMATDSGYGVALQLMHAAANNAEWTSIGTHAGYVRMGWTEAFGALHNSGLLPADRTLIQSFVDSVAALDSHLK